ncbi:hypothetical protein U879_16325 [Defluviimonas sp. 20V17]|nr:lipopolysaccharide transport periplasmic protein LptA [Allgaiera indica]KDB02590.1 hypothetical protein U879_16325 [Defluviimonas sp. 20V17]SDW95501.1 lipopolysaccharide export system protein LptA [Allgaiera indica]
MFRASLLGLGLALPVHAAIAQGTQVPLGGFKTDPSAPIQVTADKLQVNQADGTALFSGNVIVGQGKMRLSADKVHVTYAKPVDGQKGKIQTLEATGGVTLVTSPTEAAQAKTAVYTLQSGTVVMTGSVLLTQGQNVLSGQKLVVNLPSGMGTMEGRVTTTLQPNAAPKAPPSKAKTP